MLNAHKRLAVPHEFKYFREVHAYCSPSRWRTELSEAEYEDLVDSFLAKRTHIFDEIGVDVVRKNILDDPERTIRGPYKTGAASWCAFYGKSRWGEKTPFNLFYVDLLYDMFPEARFIYVVRDPRAVVTSMNTIEYFSDDTVINALNWRSGAGDGYHGFLKSLPDKSRMVMSYEQLVSDPSDTLNRLCSFVGEDFDPEMLSFYKESKRYMNPVIRTENVTKTVTNTSMERWREHLTPREVGLIEYVCRDEMELHGYDLEGIPVSGRDRLMIALKEKYYYRKKNENKDTLGYNVPFGDSVVSRLLNKIGSAGS